MTALAAPVASQRPSSIVLRTVAAMQDEGLPEVEDVRSHPEHGCLPKVILHWSRTPIEFVLWARKIKPAGRQITVDAYSNLCWAHLLVTGKTPAGPMVQVEQRVRTNLIPGMREGEIRSLTLAELEALAGAA